LIGAGQVNAKATVDRCQPTDHGSPILLGIYTAGEKTPFQFLFESLNGKWCLPFGVEVMKSLKQSSPYPTLVTFDGKTIGQGSMVLRDGNPSLEKLVNQKIIETLAKKVRKLPFITTTLKTGFADPQHWKPAKVLTKGETTAFRKSMETSVLRCMPSEDKRRDIEQIEIKNSYRDAAGNLLLRFGGNSGYCTGESAENMADMVGELWIYIPTAGNAVILPTDGDLVDAGAYNGGDQSELLFLQRDDVEGAPRNHFVLFYGKGYSQRLDHM